MQEMLKTLKAMEEGNKSKDPGLNSVCVANGAIVSSSVHIMSWLPQVIYN